MASDVNYKFVTFLRAGMALVQGSVAKAWWAHVAAPGQQGAHWLRKVTSL